MSARLRSASMRAAVHFDVWWIWFLTFWTKKMAHRLLLPWKTFIESSSFCKQWAH